MTDQVLPLNPVPNEVVWRLLDNSGVNGAGPWGATQTIARPGNRWACRLTWNNLKNADRHKLMAFAASLAGRANRVWVMDVSTASRGSMSAPETFVNSEMASISSWSATDTLSAKNGVLRLTVSVAGNNNDIYQSSATVVTQYLPCAVRSVVRRGRDLSGVTLGPYINETGVNYYTGITAAGYAAIWAVPASTTLQPYSVVQSETTGYTAGAYFEQTFASGARCLLVDNGANFFQYSDQVDNAYWTKSGMLSTTANAATAPDNTATADVVVENTTASIQHYITRTETRVNAPEEWHCFGSFKRVVGVRNVRLAVGSSGSDFAVCAFDLGAGTAGSTSVTGTATAARSFIVSKGNSWYECHIVVRLAASTSIFIEYDLVQGASTVSYTGDGSSSLAVWRIGSAQSGVPTRGGQTTSAGLASGALQSGSALHVKGGPASVTGALVEGDVVEIFTAATGAAITAGVSGGGGTVSQFVRLTADLDFNAAGMGYLQFEPPIRTSPPNNYAVIVQKPMVKMMLNEDSVGWPTRPGLFSDFSLEFVEALT